MVATNGTTGASGSQGDLMVGMGLYHAYCAAAVVCDAAAPQLCCATSDVTAKLTIFVRWRCTTLRGCSGQCSVIPDVKNRSVDCAELIGGVCVALAGTT